MSCVHLLSGGPRCCEAKVDGARGSRRASSLTKAGGAAPKAALRGPPPGPLPGPCRTPAALCIPLSALAQWYPAGAALGATAAAGGVPRTDDRDTVLTERQRDAQRARQAGCFGGGVDSTAMMVALQACGPAWFRWPTRVPRSRPGDMAARRTSPTDSPAPARPCGACVGVSCAVSPDQRRRAGLKPRLGAARPGIPAGSASN
jgi:hypothetical protein